MKISIANKKLANKPQSNLEKSKYFKGLEFKTGNFTLPTFRTIVENGYTITYLYDNDSFTRDNSYMKNHYKGTQFICVDIDSCDINPNSFVESIKYKPTLLHTTFSNLTPQKQNKWCFHLFYCFEDVVYGEDNFKKVFNILTEDYKDYVDNCAKDCHRCIFTSNSTLDDYEYIESGIIYKYSDLVKDDNQEYNDLDTFFDENTDGKKIKDTSISITSNNIEASYKNFPTEEKQQKRSLKSLNWNVFQLDENFFEDMNTLSRSKFISKYSDVFELVKSTIIPSSLIERTEDGIEYANLSNINYYEVPSKYRWNNDKNKFEVLHVKKGNRTKSLMYDALLFILCNPSITKEQLVYSLVNEVYKYYDNSDKELTNYKIIGIAKYAWELEEINIEPMKKKFKIICSGELNKQKAVGKVTKLLKDEEIGSNIDLLLSVEDNMKIMKESGYKITKNRLIQFCNEYGIELSTDKQIRNRKVIDIYLKNPSKSSRELEKLCKQNGISISYKTIQTIIKEIDTGKKMKMLTYLFPLTIYKHLEKISQPKFGGKNI